MQRRLLTLVFAALATPLAAQQSSIVLDASLGAKSGAWRTAFSAWRPLLGVTGRFRVGVGVRASTFGGDPTPYTNRGSVQGALIANVSIDPAVHALDAALFAELRLADGLSLGANLDVVGVAGGSTRSSGTLTTKPQTLSYFRYGSADHGALNSEFFAVLRVTPRLGIRAGLSHYVTDYVVTDGGGAGAPSSRYQNFETVPFIAVRLRL
jgi:hypothetical protein